LLFLSVEDRAAILNNWAMRGTCTMRATPHAAACALPHAAQMKPGPG